MSEVILPVIAHASVTLNVRNRVIIDMDDGWVFYDRADYADFTDDEGNPREPYPEEISYFRWGSYAPDTDFDARIVVVAEADVPANQIFGGENNPEIM